MVKQYVYLKDVIVETGKSKSGAKRLIMAGAVRLDGITVIDVDTIISIDESYILNIGKKFWRKIIFEQGGKNENKMGPN